MKPSYAAHISDEGFELENDPAGALYNAVNDFTDRIHVLGLLAFAASIHPDDASLIFDATAHGQLWELVERVGRGRAGGPQHARGSARAAGGAR